ncbi:MAG TPA: hypothetical protein DCZ71_07265 [Ruminococcus sp.]|nr:hypothetical protein [Ruminococcus sp.]
MKRKAAFLTALAAVLSLSAVSCGKDPVGTASNDNIVLELPSETQESTEEASESTTTAATTEKKDSETTASSTDSEEDATEETKTEAAEEKTEEAATEAPKATEAHQQQEQPQQQAAPTEAPAPQQQEQPAPAQTVTLNYDTLLSNASGLISSLGTPTYEGGGASCTQGGYDVKVYRFNGVEVQAYVDGGAEYVFDVKVTNGDHPVNGLSVGMSRSEVEAVMGAGDAGNMAVYTNGNKEIDVYYNGDTVSQIELYTAV